MDNYTNYDNLISSVQKFTAEKDKEETLKLVIKVLDLTVDEILKLAKGLEVEAEDYLRNA